MALRKVCNGIWKSLSDKAKGLFVEKGKGEASPCHLSEVFDQRWNLTLLYAKAILQELSISSLPG